MQLAVDSISTALPEGVDRRVAARIAFADAAIRVANHSLFSVRDPD